MSNYNKYGLVAINVVKSGNEPIIGQKNAIKKVYKTKSSREKGCPKSAFLGLCEDGLVRGIKASKYLINSKTNLNKKYALLAITFLSKNPELSKKELWSKIKTCLGISKIHYSQMDVVFALFEGNLLVLFL